MEERQNEIIELALDRLEQEGLWFTTKEDKIYANAKNLYKLDEYGELKEESIKRIIEEVEGYFGDGAAFVIEAVNQWIEDNLVEGMLGYIDTLAMNFEIPEIVEEITAHDEIGVEDLGTEVAEEAEKLEEGKIVEAAEDYSKPVKVDNTWFRYNYKYNEVEYITHPSNEHGPIEVIDSIGLSEKAWEDKEEREAFILAWIRDLDEEVSNNDLEGEFGHLFPAKLKEISSQFKNDGYSYNDVNEYRFMFTSVKDMAKAEEVLSQYGTVEKANVEDFAEYMDLDDMKKTKGILVVKFNEEALKESKVVESAEPETAEEIKARLREISKQLAYIKRRDAVSLAFGSEQEQYDLQSERAKLNAKLRKLRDKKVDIENMTPEEREELEHILMDKGIWNGTEEDLPSALQIYRAYHLNESKLEEDAVRDFEAYEKYIMDNVYCDSETLQTSEEIIKEYADTIAEDAAKQVVNEILGETEYTGLYSEMVKNYEDTIKGVILSNVDRIVYLQNHEQELINSVLTEDATGINYTKDKLKAKRFKSNTSAQRYLDTVWGIAGREDKYSHACILPFDSNDINSKWIVSFGELAFDAEHCLGEYLAESKVVEARIHRILQKGDIYENENGVRLQIIDVDDKDQVTYKFLDNGEARCFNMQSVNNMLDVNKYKKVECKDVNFNQAPEGKKPLTEGARQRLDERNSQSADIIEQALQSITSDMSDVESGIITRTSELFNSLSDRGYDVAVSFDNGESTSSIAIGQQGANILITITNPEQPLRAFASGNFEINDDSLKMIKSIMEVLK